jgi:DNA replication factor GINS
MSETNEITINSLYTSVLRETENNSVQELAPNFYRLISDYIGKLKREEYDNIEAKIKDELVKMATEITDLLLRIRLDKITKTNTIDFTNLLDEEKFILDSEDELRERREMILSATLNGKSKLLESISEKHKTKSVVVRFLKEMDQIVGADLEKYGPFRTEDIATIPFENAQALIAQNVAMKVRTED